MDVPSVRLPGGDSMPRVGLGTGGLNGDALQRTIHDAIGAGYTLIDTAEGYGNEAAVGEAIASHDREDLFLVSKVLPKHLEYESVIGSCNASLERLGTGYVDLYLIHWPNPAISLRETMDAMATLRATGTARNVGVSNFSAYQLSCAQHVSDVPIAVNQIEFHPWRQRPDLVEYCRETGVAVQAAAPLARTEVFEDETVVDLAADYDRPPAQIVLRWALQRNVAVIPNSATTAHLRANLDVGDWELDDADCRRLDGADRDHSVYTLPPTDWTDDAFGIAR